jgi:hypothetical protein
MHKTIFTVLSAVLLSHVNTVPIASAASLGYTNTPMLPGGKWHVHDPNRPMAPVVTPGTNFSLGAPAPADAVVLFDGKDLSQWFGDRGPATWKVENGYMETVRGSRDIHTTNEFGSFQLHIEFATPTMAIGNSQGRGNSGVFLHGRFEIQVLDNNDNRTYADGACGAVYGQFPPLANACKKPGEWQSYDIVFEAPQWDENKQLVKPAFVTIIQNGILVQNHQEILGNTGHQVLGKYSPYSGRGVIGLQDHANPVRYRNIWIRPLQ